MCSILATIFDPQPNTCRGPAQLASYLGRLVTYALLFRGLTHLFNTKLQKHLTHPHLITNGARDATFFTAFAIENWGASAAMARRVANATPPPPAAADHTACKNSISEAQAESADLRKKLEELRKQQQEEQPKSPHQQGLDPKDLELIRNSPKPPDDLNEVTADWLVEQMLDKTKQFNTVRELKDEYEKIASNIAVPLLYKGYGLTPEQALAMNTEIVASAKKLNAQSVADFKKKHAVKAPSKNSPPPGKTPNSKKKKKKKKGRSER